MDDKRKQIKNFFLVHKAVFPSMKALLLKIAFFLFGFGLFAMWYFNNVWIVWVFSFLCIFGGIYAFYKWITPYYAQKAAYAARPTPEQMEDWFLEDMNLMIKPKAISSFSLEPQNLKKENFIIVPHPVFWNVGGVKPEQIVRRHTDEHSFLYTIWNVSVIAMTENYISCYSCIYNWLENQITNVRTNEFFYTDISSISDNVEILPHQLVDDVTHSHAHEKQTSTSGHGAEKHTSAEHKEQKTESKYHQTEEDLHVKEKVYHTKEGKEHSTEHHNSHGHEHNDSHGHGHEQEHNHNHDHSHDSHSKHNTHQHEEKSSIHKIETTHKEESHSHSKEENHTQHNTGHGGAEHGGDHHEALTAKIVRITNLSSEQMTIISEIPTMHVNHKTVNTLEKVIKVIRILVRNKRFGEVNQVIKTEHHDNTNHHH